MQELSTYALEPLYLSNHRLLCVEHREILNEGMKEIVLDALQYLVGAISEYGLAVTIAGAPAGPVLETITDAAFVTESVASAMEAIGDVISMFGELKAIIQAIFSLSLEGGFDSFYDEVRNIWQSIDSLMPDTSTETLEEYIETAKETIEGVLQKFTDFVSDAVKLIIPEATIGTVVGEALQSLLMKLAENAYSVLTGVIQQLGPFEKVVTSPNYAAQLFNEIFDGIDDLLEKVQEKMNEDPEGIAGIFQKVATATPAGMAQEILAEKALESFRDFIVSKRPEILSLVKKITGVMFPAIFALMASYQILMKGEWKSEGEEDEENLQKSTVPAEKGSIETLLAANKQRSLLPLIEITGGIGVEAPVGYGKNYHTQHPDQPITWENLEGPEYFVTSQADGTVLAAVSLPEMSMSTPTYQFGDEASAMSWVRNTFEKFRRELMATER